MLVELAIRDFAIIDAVQIAFHPGLNVLTGETGAGKSILIDALGAVLGDRVSAELVRGGARSASVDATFDLNLIANASEITRVLSELDVELEDGIVILSREIHSSGRSNARLNGRPTTASILTQVGGLLVDIHGQSDHLSLLKPAAQLDMLDRFAQVEDERAQFAATLRSLRSTRQALADTLAGARDRMQRIDLLQFQVDEIRRANLQPGEEEELTSERGRLANADRLASDAAAAYVAIAGGEDDAPGAGLPVLRQAALLLEEMSALDPATTPLKERLNELVYLLEDVAADARSYRDGIEADPARLAAVEERLAALRQLKRKYGADVTEILAFGAAAEDELARLTGSESDAEALAAREEHLGAEAGVQAAELSARRKAAATQLAADVEHAIESLNMGSAQFSVSVEQSEDPLGIPVPSADGPKARIAADATGVDRVTFQIAPNPGEGLKPLSKIASGGETARLMLALKSILSEVDRTPTLVFDEIDVGVGGRSGQVVGEKLWDLAANHQVIAITHLPQIAAFADAHFQIAKLELDGRVVSTVNELELSARQQELAAMLDGTPTTPSSVKAAKEMLARAASAKRRENILA
jgi:DNA repair protein RecN (Recombination protein N)